MAKLFMMAGGIVEPGGGRAGAVSAYVVLSGGREGARIFKVHGSAEGPAVSELPRATTVDLARFQSEVEQDLAPALDELAARGAQVAVATPKAMWICGLVRAHVKQTDGLDLP